LGQTFGIDATDLLILYHTRNRPSSLERPINALTGQVKMADSPEVDLCSAMLSVVPRAFIGTNPTEEPTLPLLTAFIGWGASHKEADYCSSVPVQFNWRDRCPLKDALFLGYANGCFDYFPTVEASAEGGYGAADSNTCVQIGAGERMVRQGLTRVYEMLGRLRDTPEKE
jgi:hypothetical protein